MKILRLNVKGFRSLKDVSWEPEDLNIIIGPNATGKSNLLRMLELISVSAAGGLGKYVQKWGGMEPLLWDGSADKIEFSVETSPINPSSQSDIGDNLTYTLAMERVGRASFFQITRELLSDERPQIADALTEPSVLLKRTKTQSTILDEMGEPRSTDHEIDAEESVLSSARNPFARVDHTLAAFCSYLAGWSVYHDLHVDAEATIRQPAVTRYEKHVLPDGQNLVSVLHTLYTEDRDFRSNIDDAMKTAFNGSYEELAFPPAAEQRIQMGIRWKPLRRVQVAPDLSDGTLRFLFLLAVLASPSPAPVIAIDEPEVGLHPSMLRIIAEYAVEASRRAQVIFTTHSAQFLDAFGDTKPATTVAKWPNGETQFKKLQGEALDYWLKEYSLGSLYGSGELEEIE